MAIPKNIENQLNKVDPERLEGYMKMLDRTLLYNMAASILPRESMNSILELWEKTVKKSIDMDCQKFTNFLQKTPQGRLASMMEDQPDGEEMRLKFLETFDLAHQIVVGNLTPPDGIEFNEFDSNS